MKIAVLGGTFDPIHWGHLVLAECVRDQSQVDIVFFAPAAVPPHKQDEPMTDIQHRIEMTRLAIESCEAFELTLLDADPGEPSYSIETLDRLCRIYPQAESIRFVMGGDQLAEIETWKDYDRVLREYGVLAVRRPGTAANGIWERYGDYVIPIEMPQIAVSSTLIREFRAEKRSIRFLVPGAVERYIVDEGLYLPG